MDTYGYLWIFMDPIALLTFQGLYSEQLTDVPPDPCRVSLLTGREVSSKPQEVEQGELS